MFVARMVLIGALVPVSVGTSRKRDGAGATQARRAKIFGLLHFGNAHRGVVRVNSLASLFCLALTSAPRRSETCVESPLWGEFRTHVLRILGSLSLVSRCSRQHDLDFAIET